MKRVSRIGEWILLVIGVLLALLPLTNSVWYHTGDGPFHLYSATVLNDLLFHSGEAFGGFFDLHITPVPNTTILIFQAFLLELFKPNSVLIITLLLNALGIIIGYLYCVKSINPEHKGISLLVLPVVISFFTILGFFSFLASLTLMFFTIGYFHKNAVSFTWKHLLILTVLITVNWFTHFIGTLFSMAYITLYIILKGREGLILLRTLFFVSIPFVILSLIFGKDAAKADPFQFESFSYLLNSFRNSAPLICYHPDEINFMKYFQYLLLLLLPISIYYFFKKQFRLISMTPLIFSFLLILVFFLIPANWLSVKFINFRLLFCAILFSCVFIEIHIPRIFLLLTIPAVFFILFKKQAYQLPIVKAYSKSVESVVKNTEMLPKGKAVVAMNYSNNWLEYNICLYPATVYRTVILDNEEASTYNSVIRWKNEKEPNSNIGTVLKSSYPVLKLNYEKDANEKIVGFFRWKYPGSNFDSTTKSNDSLINAEFNLHKSVDGLTVYLRK